MSKLKKEGLVVDDSATVRKVISKIINELGFDNRNAPDGATALKLCKERLPDFIILDWNMPNMDGMEFFKAFKKIPERYKCKVIFCTTESEIEKIMTAIDEGADEYIMKPFNKEILEDKLIEVGIL